MTSLKKKKKKRRPTTLKMTLKMIDDFLTVANKVWRKRDKFTNVFLFFVFYWEPPFLQKKKKKKKKKAEMHDLVLKHVYQSGISLA